MWYYFYLCDIIYYLCDIIYYLWFHLCRYLWFHSVACFYVHICAYPQITHFLWRRVSFNTSQNTYISNIFAQTSPRVSLEQSRSSATKQYQSHQSNYFDFVFFAQTSPRVSLEQSRSSATNQHQSHQPTDRDTLMFPSTNIIRPSTGRGRGLVELPALNRRPTEAVQVITGEAQTQTLSRDYRDCWHQSTQTPLVRTRSITEVSTQTDWVIITPVWDAQPEHEHDWRDLAFLGIIIFQLSIHVWWCRRHIWVVRNPDV